MFSQSLGRRFCNELPRIAGRRSMSVRPQQCNTVANAVTPPRKKVTLQKLSKMRAQQTPITVLTAYDYPTATHCENNAVDICLVGDSLAQVCLGYDSTTQLTLDEVIHHCKAVARGAKSPHLVADMPFGTYHTSIPDTVRNAVRIVQEGRMESVKLEGGEEIAETVRALTRMGIPVMAHVGLLPQRHTSLSGYRVQGRDAQSALSVLRSALALQDAGAYSIVLEAVPAPVAAHITQKLSIPTIGIGAGPGCSGQVLVWDDAMGNWCGHKAKFVRRFAELGKVADQGLKAYVTAVREGTFPGEEESYQMDDLEWQKFVQLSESCT